MDGYRRRLQALGSVASLRRCSCGYFLEPGVTACAGCMCNVDGAAVGEPPLETGPQSDIPSGTPAKKPPTGREGPPACGRDHGPTW